MLNLEFECGHGICGSGDLWAPGIYWGLWEQGVGLLIDIQARQRHVLGSRGLLDLKVQGVVCMGLEFKALL